MLLCCIWIGLGGESMEVSEVSVAELTGVGFLKWTGGWWQGSGWGWLRKLRRVGGRSAMGDGSGGMLIEVIRIIVSGIVSFYYGAI